MGLEFEKLHGLGNDYVVIDERQETVVTEKDKPFFAREVCRRGFSVGADGVLFAGPADGDDVQMRIFNADGSEAESCANGLRCLAYFHHGLSNNSRSQFTIHLSLADNVEATVKLEKKQLANVQLRLNTPGAYHGKKILELDSLSLNYHRVDVGNPHAVFFLDENTELPDNLKQLKLAQLGSQIQAHPDFKNSSGINAEFVVSEDKNTISMRVHERGVGETTACGTGSIAIATACLETARASGWIKVKQPGGVLKIEPAAGMLEGPAAHSFSGRLP